ncbi:MAG: hypothetical protein EXR33_07130 [Betaproteobacteria bacterium]|nr:hypothetical protein [Betaproteobacteria bacterium]
MRTLDQLGLSPNDTAAIVGALYDIQLRYDVLLSPLVVPTTEWEAGLYSVLPLHREIERDGIAA